MKDPSELTHYEVLELAPGCAIDDLSKAYAQAKERYGPGSLATYALAEPGEAEAVLRRVEEAFAVLADPEQRRIYDSARGFSTPGLPREPAPVEEIQAPPPVEVESPRPAEVESPPLEVGAVASVPVAPEAAPVPVPEPVAAPLSASEAVAAAPPIASLEPPPEHKPVRKTESDLPADSAVTGDALRRVREARGLSLKDVEGRTKIGHWHLENIERERYADLPAQVYLRGFLMSFARELKLDPVRVAKSYLEQMKVKSQAKPE